MTFVSLRALGATFAAAALTASAGADIVAPGLEFYMQVNGGDEQEFYPTGTQTGENTWNWNGWYSDPGWTMQYNIDGDIDPIVQNFIALTNSSAVTNVYSVTVILPTIAIPGGSLIDGSVGGSVTDANGDGFAQAAALGGDSIYTGLIDLAAAPGATLLPSPYSATVNVNGGTSAIGPASFGQPVPIAGPGVVGNIGIRLTFSLTPGDTIALTSFFRVVPVPAPGGLALLAFAGLGARRRRR